MRNNNLVLGFRLLHTPGRCTLVLAALLVLPFVPDPGAAAGQAPDAARIIAAVDSIVESELARGRAAGMSVAIVRSGDTLVLKGYGRANLELEVLTPERAVYDIGSQGKMFTGAAILQLVEHGKLSLADPVEKHLPGLLSDDIGRRVTIRQLLTHTSGIQDFVMIPEFRQIQQQTFPQPPPFETLIKLIAAQPLDFEPGAAMVYSNSGYVLLALILERLSGRSLEEYFEQVLFAQAGLGDTRNPHPSEIVPRMANGYLAGPQGLQPGAYLGGSWWNRGAGGLLSTAGDMAAWLRALHGGRILGRAAYQELITPGTLNDGTLLRYASGVVLHAVRGHRAFSHGGSLPTGFDSFGTYLPDDDLAVVVLANTQGGASTEVIVERIVDFMLGDRRPVSGTFEGRAEEYVGNYRAGAPLFAEVAAIATDDMGRLTMSLDGGSPFPLDYYGGDRFGADRGFLYFTFVRANGLVVGARWEMPTAVLMFHREAAESRPSR